MSSFRVRIDTMDDKSIKEWCTLFAEEYVIVAHVLPHGNPHIHIYFKSYCVYSVDAFRMRVKRQFKPEKASDYSVKKCEDERADEFIAYLFNTKHGNKHFLISHNIDPARLDKCVSAAKEVSDNFELSKKTRKPTGPSQYDMSCEVYQLITLKYGSQLLPTENDESIVLSMKRDMEIYEDCVRTAIMVCHKYRKGFDKFSLQKIVHPAYVRFNNCKEQFVESIVSNYFRFLNT